MMNSKADKNTDVNHVSSVRLKVKNNEVVMEFFHDGGEASEIVKASSAQFYQIAMSFSGAKETATNLLSLVSEFENLAEQESPENETTILLEKDVWDEVEALYGAWSDIPEAEIDELFNDLRANDRLADIYGDDWD